MLQSISFEVSGVSSQSVHIILQLKTIGLIAVVNICQGKENGQKKIV